MSSVLNELINNEIDVVNELIKIDNKVCNTNFTIEDLSKKNNLNIKILGDTLFVTEGDPNITIAILDELIIHPDNKYYLFINQRFLALNKWLIARFICLTNIRIELITDINYNKYINRDDIYVVPIGEKELVEQVNEDFS